MDAVETETFLARDIELIREKARYDAACKKLLGEKIILAWIMKSCLEEYKHCTVNEIAGRCIEGEPSVGETPVMPDETNAVPRIHGIGGEDTSLTEGKILYDIRFIATAPATGELIRLIINVEAQGSSSVGYPLLKRAIYYCCRMISSQHGTEFVNEHYEKIKKVYSIFICTSPKKRAPQHDHALSDDRGKHGRAGTCACGGLRPFDSHHALPWRCGGRE